jgi:hypothetical protein
VDFLRDNNIYATVNEVAMVIAAYDGDKDKKVDFREFEKLIIPNDYSLKMRAYDRHEPYIGYRDKLHFEVEY